MFLFFRLYKQQFTIGFIIAALFLWAFTVSVKLLTFENETLLIRVDNLQTALIEEQGKARIPIEIENFLNHFVGYFYSYTSDNFDQHIDIAIKSIAQDEAIKHVPKLNAMSDKVKQKPIVQTAMVSKIANLRDLEFEITMRVVRIEGTNESEDDFVIRLVLKPVDRTTTLLALRW